MVGNMPASPNYFEELIPNRIVKLKQVLLSQLWKDRKDLNVLGGPVLDEFIPVADVNTDQFTLVRPGETFGPPGGGWKQRWLLVDIPAPIVGEEKQRFLFWDCRGETTVYLDGEPWAGLNVAHDYCILPDKACRLFLDCGTYQTAVWYPGKAIDQYGLKFEGAWIAKRNPVAWEAYWDLVVLIQLMDHLLKENGLEDTVRSWGPFPEPVKAHPLLRRLLKSLDQAYSAWENGGLNDLANQLKNIYREFPAENWQPVINIFGHSHLDLVWMWPELVGERKAINSFATALRLLDEYPEYTYMWTSPANYQALERRSAGLYGKIMDQIKTGRWEATGGAWAEFDTLIACGEALARSLALGQSGFKKMRGSYSTTLWLPDCFGFNVCLPQLMRLSQIKNFATSKLSWNSSTRFPYQSFIWRSPDGSEVLAHLDVTGASDESIHSLVEVSRSYRQLGTHQEILKWTGVGDGGGGTTVAAIETIKRWKNLSGTPRVSWGNVESFFDRLDRVRKDLPRYEGELYLEFHRGIYTTQSEFKRRYRALERSLQVWEAVRAVFSGGSIPAAFWERLCFAQFHDALPGSSIPLVYEQLGTALEFLAGKAIERAQEDFTKVIDQSAILPAFAIFNPLAIGRQVVVELPMKSDDIKVNLGLSNADGEPLPVQVTGQGTDKRLITSLSIDGLATRKTYTNTTLDQTATNAWEVSQSTLANGILKVEFDNRGMLQRITENGSPWQLAGMPHLSLYPDFPPSFDAWEIDQNATRNEIPIIKYMPLEVVESGPVRGILRGILPLGDASRLQMSFILEAKSTVLRIEVKVFWHEKHHMLKYNLPTLFHGRMARYGAPFGSVLRQQVPGISREEAAWEVPGSRWAAVTDDAGWDGLAIIAEAKYGFSCRDGNLGLTLLRSPVDPTREDYDLSPWHDPLHSTEEGEHVIRFAVSRYRPKSNSDGLSTAALAETLYAPMLIAPVLTNVMNNRPGPVKFNPYGDLQTIVPSWILPAQNSSGYIIRLHETMGVEGKLVLEFDDAVNMATLVDFLEQPSTIGEITCVDDRHYQVNYHPYQILSILVN